jgi:hypothetical protein
LAVAPPVAAEVDSSLLAVVLSVGEVDSSPLAVVLSAVEVDSSPLAVARLSLLVSLPLPAGQALQAP